MADSGWVENYSTRIATGLRYDGYGNRLTPIDARLIGSLYGVELEHREYTIKEVSLAVAEGVLR